MYMIMTDRGWRPFHALNVPCPNSNKLEGVYRPQPRAQVQAANSARADRFLEANSLSLMSKQEYFRGNSFIEPITGAFGEKL